MAKRDLPMAPVVPLELWRALYQAASEFQLLAPWRWMDARHILGINSALGVRLVTVMGSLGEVFGLASYRGTAGTNFLLRLLRREFCPETTEVIYHQDALLVDFVSRKELRKISSVQVSPTGWRRFSLSLRERAGVRGISFEDP